MGKINCEACRKSCKGQAIKLQERYFHLKCFKCRECKKPLATGGFYTKNESHYCVEDYQRLFGVKCHFCGQFVEGEVVTALGNTYHEGCFHCTKCNKKFDPGDKVTFSHQNYLCNDCVERSESPSTATPVDPGRVQKREEQQQKTSPPLMGSISAPSTPAKQENLLMDGHLSTPALDYSSDAKPIENGFSGVTNHTPATNTSGYKSDMSFDRNTPASRYSDVFDGSYTDGKDFNRDDDVGHESDVFLDVPNGFHSHYGKKGPGRRSRLSPIQNIMRYRSISPGSTYSQASRKSKDSTGSLGSRFDADYGKFLKMSYLEKLADYKRGPSINPIQKEKSPQHYHRPENFSYSKVRRDFIKPAKKGLLTALGDHEYVTTLRKIEPYKPVKTQEPIQMSKMPDAHKCDGLAPIERDYWPAPPAAAAAYPDLLREHRLQRRSTDVTNSMIEDEVDSINPKIERDIQELSKMTGSGCAKGILEDLRKIKTEGSVLDPRSSSRVPSAANEPPYKPRYESSVFASPSRDLDQRLRLRSLDCLVERKYRTSTLPISNFPVEWRSYELPKNLVRSVEVPRPGYSLAIRSSALDGRYQNSFDGIDVSQPRRPDSSFAVLQRSSYYSSQSSVDDYDPTTGLRKNPRLRSATVSEGFMSPYFGYRRSVPSLFKVEEPPKIYAYEQLKQFAGKLPPDVSKETIEQHLTQDEFEAVFAMSQDEFYRLPEWKRNDMKTRIGLFY